MADALVQLTRLQHISADCATPHLLVGLASLTSLTRLTVKYWVRQAVGLQQMMHVASTRYYVDLHVGIM